MALTKIPRGLLDTGIADSSDATAITIDSSENVAIASGALAVGQSTFSGGNVLADFHGSGNAVGAQLAFANDHNTDKFYVGLEGNTTGDGFLYQEKDADINFYTNDTFRVKIDNSGKVGIGTNAPTSPLHISSATNRTLLLDYTAGSGGYSWMSFKQSGTEKFRIFGSYADGYLSFYNETQSAHQLTLASGGNVSIGNSSVAFPSGEGLQVYSSGNPRIKLANSTTGVASGDGTQFYLDGADVIYDNKDSGTQRWYTGGSERMRIASDGIVTIRPDTGATTGTLRLHNGNGNSTLGQIQFGHSGNVDHGSIKYTGNMDFFTGDGDYSKFFISSAGNVGINTSNPEHHLHVTEPGDTREDGIVKIGGSTTGLGLELKYDQGGATTTEIVANPTYTNTSSIMRLCVDRDANANQIVLTGQGNTGFGTDAPGSSRLYVYQDIDATFTAYFSNDHSGGYGVGVRSDSDSMMYFYNGGTFRGRIYHNGSTMLYADQSDYRLKENVQKMTGSIDRIKKLNPVTFDWKADGKAAEGFLAHEVQEVVPTAVSGEKDAEITEVGEGIQIMDYGKVTPVLVGALQEALAKIEALEAKVAALESK